jgi:hypothetical protein
VRKLSRRISLPRSTMHQHQHRHMHRHRHKHKHKHRHFTQSLRFASRCNIFDGSPTFDGGTEADSGSDVNRIIADSLGVKHAPVARHCHLGRVMDLFVQ